MEDWFAQYDRLAIKDELFEGQTRFGGIKSFVQNFCINAYDRAPESEYDIHNYNQCLESALDLMVEHTYLDQALRIQKAKKPKLNNIDKINQLTHYTKVYRKYHEMNLPNYQQTQEELRFYLCDIEDFFPRDYRVQGRKFVVCSPHNQTNSSKEMMLLLGMPHQNNEEFKASKKLKGFDEPPEDPIQDIRQTFDQRRQVYKILTQEQLDIYTSINQTLQESSQCLPLLSKCNKYFKAFFQQNYKRFFFKENIGLPGSETINGMYELELIEVSETFPTISTLQTVLKEKQTKHRVHRVQHKYTTFLYQYIRDVRPLLEEDQSNQINLQFQAYLTISGISGGIDGVVDDFFSEANQAQFGQLTRELKNKYYELHQLLCRMHNTFQELIWKVKNRGENTEIWQKAWDQIQHKLEKSYNSFEFDQY